MLSNDVPLRTRRALSPMTLYSNSAFLGSQQNIAMTLLININSLLSLDWRFYCQCRCWLIDKCNDFQGQLTIGGVSTWGGPSLVSSRLWVQTFWSAPRTCISLMSTRSSALGAEPGSTDRWLVAVDGGCNTKYKQKDMKCSFCIQSESIKMQHFSMVHCFKIRG